MVEVHDRVATHTLLAGSPVELFHHGEPFRLAVGEPAQLEVPEPLDLPKPSQPAWRAPTRRGPA